MANLKLDLINKLNDIKFYAELELVRLAREENMNYKDKINGMDEELNTLAFVEIKLSLVEKYFQEPAQQQPPAQQQAPVQADAEQPLQMQQPTPQQVANNGQSHKE